MILVAHIGLTYNCNMKCKHCFVIRDKNRMKTEDWRKFLNLLSEKGLFYIYYTHGEPLLSDNFFEVANLVKKEKIYQTLMSNGYFIDSDMAKKIKKEGINQVMISLDSHDSKEHDENRGKVGAWNKAIKAIRALKAEGVKVGIATTITEENVSSMDEIVKIGESLGVNKISFLRVRENNKLGKINNIVKYHDQVSRLIKEEKKELQFLFHDFSIIPLVKKMYNDGDIDEDKYYKFFHMNSCYSDEVINIDPCGNVYKCNFNNDILGNLKDENIEKILKKYYIAKSNC